MGKKKLKFTEIMVIVHGKSELWICEYVKSNLKIKMEIISEKKGKNSIQINGLMNILNNTIFKSKNTFLRKYTDIDVGKKKKINNFKLFIIMDVDDCNETEKSNFINKEMFRNHWLYDYIVPIYNDINLEDVLKRCNVKYEIKSNKEKKNYVKIFPVNRDKIDKYQIIEFKEELKKAKDKTNMGEFLTECLKIQDKY